MENNNMGLWDIVSETDPKHTKAVTFGRKFTSINAQYQIKQATKYFGKYGESWGISTIDYDYINLDKGQILALVKSIFFFVTNDKKHSFPVSTSILIQDWDKKNSCLRIDDEFAKKAETDITTKALSKLGFSADVFLGRYDDNRYINSLKEKYKDDTPPPPETKKEKPKTIWLTSDQYDKALLSTSKGITATINAFSKPGYSMKLDYKTKLLEKLKELNTSK